MSVSVSTTKEYCVFHSPLHCTEEGLHGKYFSFFIRAVSNWVYYQQRYVYCVLDSNRRLHNVRLFITVHLKPSYNAHTFIALRIFGLLPSIYFFYIVSMRFNISFLIQEVLFTFIFDLQFSHRHSQFIIIFYEIFFSLFP